MALLRRRPSAPAGAGAYRHGTRWRLGLKSFGRRTLPSRTEAEGEGRLPKLNPDAALHSQMVAAARAGHNLQRHGTDTECRARLHTWIERRELGRRSGGQLCRRDEGSRRRQKARSREASVEQASPTAPK